jgi:hypothetical protein
LPILEKDLKVVVTDNDIKSVITGAVKMTKVMMKLKKKPLLPGNNSISLLN